MDTFADRGFVDRAPLVGRAREVGRLDALLGCRTEGAGPAAVDVTGEPGIGKTALLTEFAVRAGARGVTVLSGRAGAAEEDRTTPFQAFLDAFADLGHRERAITPALAELARLVERDGSAEAAGVAGVVGVAAEESGACAGEGGQGYGERVRRIGAALGRVPAPGLVLLLDDLHGADPASVALVDHLLRHPLRAPVLLVVARRERQTPPALASALARAADCGVLARMDLGPLEPHDCAGTVTPGLPPDTVAELHAASRGNPLYFRALAHARTRRGGAPGSGPAALLLDELTSLGPAERAVVEALAVLDGRATPELLAAVATGGEGSEGSEAGEVGEVGEKRKTIGEALRDLARRDLLRPDEDGRTLGPRHPALPELIRGVLDPWRRRELHRRAAFALARAGAPATERAPHLMGAATGRDAATAAVLVEAAERIGTVDPARAAHWLAAALDQLPDTPEHLSRRGELTLRRAQALGSAGRVAESRDLLHRLIDTCRPWPGTALGSGTTPGPGTAPGSGLSSAPAPAPAPAPGLSSGPVPGPAPGLPDTAGLRTSAVLLCAFMERHLGRYAEADALLRRELERTPGPRPDLRTGLVVEWGARALFATRYPEVREEADRTLDEARSRRDAAETAEVLTLSALGEVYEGETATARARATEAAALTDALTDGELADHAESLVRLAWAEAFLEEYRTAERHTARGIAAARRAGRPFALSQLLLCSAYVHLLTGRVGAALDLAEESLAVARTLGGAELLGFSGAIRATVLLHARPIDDPEALAAAEQAAATVGTAQGWWPTQARCLLAHCLPLGHDPHRVREALVRAGGDPDLSRLQPSLRPGYLELLAGAALAAGDLAEAERAARRALAEAEGLGLPVQRGAAQRARGRVLAHRGESAAAAGAFIEAARESASSGATLREAHSLLLAAPHVQASGDAPRAAALWRRGRRLAAEGGARLLVDLADRTGPAPADGGAGGRLAVLTPREREISALVAEGLTNQAVADRLCLSPRTVESHVARVYRKTGVETRAGLASLVVRNGVGGGQSLRG